MFSVDCVKPNQPERVTSRWLSRSLEGTGYAAMLGPNNSVDQMAMQTVKIRMPHNLVHCSSATVGEDLHDNHTRWGCKNGHPDDTEYDDLNLRLGQGQSLEVQ